MGAADAHPVPGRTSTRRLAGVPAGAPDCCATSSVSARAPSCSTSNVRSSTKNRRCDRHQPRRRRQRVPPARRRHGSSGAAMTSRPSAALLDEQRLVTVAGLGGVGKTSLARTIADDWPRPSRRRSDDDRRRRPGGRDRRPQPPTAPSAPTPASRWRRGRRPRRRVSSCSTTVNTSARPPPRSSTPSSVPAPGPGPGDEPGPARTSRRIGLPPAATRPARRHRPVPQPGRSTPHHQSLRRRHHRSALPGVERRSARHRAGRRPLVDPQPRRHDRRPDHRHRRHSSNLAHAAGPNPAAAASSTSWRGPCGRLSPGGGDAVPALRRVPGRVHDGRRPHDDRR